VFSQNANERKRKSVSSDVEEENSKLKDGTEQIEKEIE
jgi:hypothetical protein